MSEKRFVVETVEITDGCTLKGRIVKAITDKNELYTYSDIYEIGDLLNELAEENEQLKFENETLKSNYQREIQSSIDFCNAYSKTNGELLEEIEKLEKENEQLKYDNTMFKQIIKTFPKVAQTDKRRLEEENEQLKKEHKIAIDEMITDYKNLEKENEQLKNDDLLFFQQVFNILMKYQHLFNREMADEVLEDLGIELTEWFE